MNATTDPMAAAMAGNALIFAIILIGLFALMVYTLFNGNRARGRAVVEDVPVKKAIHNAESGCMGILFAVAGMVLVLFIIAAAFPGK